MKVLFTLLLLMLLDTVSFAQTPGWLWAQSTGTSGYQNAVGIVASASGDIYTGGRLNGGTSPFMGLSITSPSVAPFHARFQPSGNFVWGNARPYGSFDYMFAFSKDDADNTYSTGCANSGGSGMFFQRYNNTGTVTFTQTITTSNTQGTGIVADAKGNMYVAGFFTNPTTFGTTTFTSAGSDDAFLAKYNSTGVIQWAKHIGAAGKEQIRGMTIDRQGNLYIAGQYTSGSPMFGTLTTPPATGIGNYFVARYDTNGNAIWVKTINNAGPVTSPDVASDITLDSCGYLYVTSTFQGSTQVGTQTITSLGGYDVFLGKLSAADGTWQWVKTAGGPSNRDEGTGIVLDKDFDVYIAGMFQDTLHISGVTINGGTPGRDNIFVAKYANSTGDLQWVQHNTGTGDLNSSDIAVDQQKFVYVLGVLSGGTAVFGSTSKSNTNLADICIAKLDTLPDRKIIPHLALDYCIGSDRPLPYSIIGPFNAGNTFTAQLSDSSGSFNTVQNIGSLAATSSGTITIKIPVGTPRGNHYKIRIISSSPAYSSYDYCMNITITGPCKPDILNGDSTILTTVYCFEDKNFPLLGTPRGGTFTGCGIVDINGQWYFNPALAVSGAAVYPHTCSIRYQLPTGEDSIATMLVNKAESVDAGADRVTCDGKFDLAATVTSGNAADYNLAWTPSIGLSGSTTAATSGAISSSSQMYYINIENKTTGCKAQDSVTIFRDQFEATIVPDKDTLCALTALNVTAVINPEKLVSYNWNMGDGTTASQPTVQNIYNNVGSYTIQLITRDAYCSDTTPKVIYVTDFKISLEPNKSIVEMDEEVTLQTSGSEPYHIIEWRPIEWFGDQGTLSQTFVPKKSGAEYTVIGVSDRFGCIDSARTEVRLNSIVYVPNAFTPNGDGKNDYFRPVGAGEPFTVNSFAIYDRWGKQVFSSYGATALKGWDGTYSGQPAEMGSYFYTIEVEKYNGKTMSQKGDLTLIR